MKFHKSYRYKLSARIYVRCKNCVWWVKYDAKNYSIFGLRKFMMFYGVKLFDFIQFDYYRGDMFVVTIFNESVLEPNYPVIEPPNFFNSEKAKNCKREDFVIERGTVEYEKR